MNQADPPLHLRRVDPRNRISASLMLQIWPLLDSQLSALENEEAAHGTWSHQCFRIVLVSDPGKWSVDVEKLAPSS